MEKDKAGTEHFYMHFNVRTGVGSLVTRGHATNIVQVEGPKNKGTVNLHLIKRPGESDFSYQTLALDIKGKLYCSVLVIMRSFQDADALQTGNQRIYLENADANKFDKSSSGKMFGVRWW